MPQQSPQATPAAESTGCIAGLVRVTWLLFGNAAPFFLAVYIALGSGYSTLDVFYWASILGLSLLRYIDIAWLKGLTADGKPATLRHWQRYTLFLFLISAGAWVVAHLV